MSILHKVDNPISFTFSNWTSNYSVWLGVDERLDIKNTLDYILKTW